MRLIMIEMLLRALSLCTCIIRRYAVADQPLRPPKPESMRCKGLAVALRRGKVLLNPSSARKAVRDALEHARVCQAK
jgi:hypothetical protein